MANFFKKFIELSAKEGKHTQFPSTVGKTILQIYQLDKWRWNLLLCFSTTAAIMEPVIMWFLGKFIDNISTGKLSPENALTSPYFLFVIFMFLIIIPVFDSIENFIQNMLITTRSVQRTRFRAMNYLTRQSVDFFSNEMAGRLASKAFEFSRAAGDLMLTLMTQTWYVLAFFLGTLAFCINAHWMLGLVLLGWGAVSISLIAFFTPIIARRSTQTVESYSTAMGRSVDILSNISLTKLFSRPESENIGFMGLLNEHVYNVFHKNKAVTTAVALIYLTNGIFVAGIIFLAIWQWTNNIIPIGVIVALFPLVLRIRVQTDWLFMQASMLSEQYGSVLNGIEVLQRPFTVLDKPDAQALQPVKGNIKFENVNFTYPSGRQIFNGLTLEIPEGQKVGLVGPSGAGKTTLVNLLLRFYDLDSGHIKIDGINIDEVTQDSLRAQISMVTQEPALLNRSILENLKYGNIEATQEQIEHAAQQAAAHEFIPHLKDTDGRTGYQAHVGERGIKLSGGQRQRIAIGRLILKNAPIMLLDEATSALDSDVEAVVQEQIYPLMENRTVIAIAHRLSTLIRMDRLLVMEDGRIIEDGTHAELLAQNGLYFRLWHRQSQGFLPED
ncbi:MAG: multidrug ABC transporter ATP-binding protein [Micavibrio aeruginosavorus]|uniref:Multidrug ABC transporter ATP-binding protein n=1 Tax=Micavibrio aeruginosavorus TaxID=349221 RepID=A0A2W5FCF7_9BACT|nr:MAG: multidrug ABC transporter ATP-binding protein [Micavibrio aeruginosavorus]